ncbi:MAG TPA: hypothetical protein VH853_00425 [Polyangia bacterium]|jgi:hypothetical protein|nr:hypothetical protein [Polyangia bacterium]
MTILPDRDPQPQARAVEIVADALKVWRTRDGLPITDEQILERARNVVAALAADFELVPVGPVAELVKDLRQSLGDFIAAVETVGAALRSEVA